MTDKERKSCICTIKMLRNLALNVHEVMDVIDYENCEKMISLLESFKQTAQPSATDTNVATTDTISRQAVVDLVEEVENKRLKGEIDLTYAPMIKGIKALPSAQPNLSEAYSKAVFTWLMDYQIRTAELNGRYTPYEVLSWVINDWRKENG